MFKTQLVNKFKKRWRISWIVWIKVWLISSSWLCLSRQLEKRWCSFLATRSEILMRLTAKFLWQKQCSMNIMAICISFGSTTEKTSTTLSSKIHFLMILSLPKKICFRKDHSLKIQNSSPQGILCTKFRSNLASAQSWTQKSLPKAVIWIKQSAFTSIEIGMIKWPSSWDLCWSSSTDSTS